MIEQYLPTNFLELGHNSISYKHSMTVAKAARVIATKCNLDADIAMLCGEFHDIGKFIGIHGVDQNYMYRHPRIGYELMKNENIQVAKVCLAHPFPIKSFGHVLKFCKGDEFEANKTWDILQSIEYDEYVKLIQLCDKISGIDQYVSIEQKVEWYRSNNKISSDELNKYYVEPLTGIKNKFQELWGIDIYKLLNINNVC